MTTTFYNDLVFDIPTGVYEPREDSYLAADVLTDMDIEGKKILDIGTGCGFLAVIAAKKGAKATATDINERGIKATQKNAEKNNVELDIIKSNMFEEIDATYDIICFNAPYLPGSRDGRSVEELAWYGGENGREVIDAWIRKAETYLTTHGELLLIQSSVTGKDQTTKLFKDEGYRTNVVSEEKVAWERLLAFHAWKI